jgi:tetratricopeptide (TPR) repeat protein
MRRFLACAVFLGVPLLCLATVVFYNIPPVNERLSWRVEALQARVKYALNPPAEAVFVPAEQNAVLSAVPAWPTETATPEPTATPTVPGPTPTASVTPTPDYTPTPIPGTVLLDGFTHEYQRWNNCGPANLAMDLSYWGWQGDQYDTAAFLKPNARDHNVMPYEMVDYVQSNTNLRALTRVGGDLDTLKKFIAAGFPVLIEKGFEGAGFDGWMGHYEVINGYDDANQRVTVQDSYKGPNILINYPDLENQWRAFNYTYIITYPPEREGEVLRILGKQADLDTNFQTALQKAVDETSQLTGRDLFFAWYNRGSNLVSLHDYAAAATAYDAAFANYGKVVKELRPWRMLWYQTGPYFAYYYTQRFEDVISLANTTLQAMSEPNLEETYYWRGMAYAALGDNERAIKDFQAALKYHENFLPAIQQLQQMGVQP